VVADYDSNLLFWVDAKLHHIACSDLLGNSQRIIMTSYRHLRHPFAITVFEVLTWVSVWVTLELPPLCVLMNETWMTAGCSPSCRFAVVEHFATADSDCTLTDHLPSRSEDIRIQIDNSSQFSYLYCRDVDSREWKFPVWDWEFPGPVQ